MKALRKFEDIILLLIAPYTFAFGAILAYGGLFYESPRNTQTEHWGIFTVGLGIMLFAIYLARLIWREFTYQRANKKQYKNWRKGL